MKNQTFYTQFASHRKSKKTAIFYQGKSLTYSELYSKTETQAKFLYNEGINKRSFVTRISEIFPESVITLLALLKIGCTITVLSSHLPPKAYARRRKDKPESVLFLQDRLYKKYLPILKEKTSAIVLLSPKKDLPFSKKREYLKENKESLSVARKDGFADSVFVFPSHKKRKEVPSFSNEKKEVLIFHSLGDTRHGKTLSFSNEIRDTTTVSFLQEVSSEARKGTILPLMPLESAGGTLSGILTPISLGRSINLVNKNKVDSAIYWIKKKKADTLILLPYRYQAILSQRTSSRSKKIKSVILTLEKPTFELNESVFPYSLKQAFWANEAGGFLLGGSIQNSLTPDLGIPLTPFSVKLLPLKGTSPVQEGEEGRLAFSLPNGFFGYKEDDINKDTILFEGVPYFILDDILIYKDGHYIFSRRRNNIARFHGYPIYLDRIENISLTIPGVISAKVFFDRSINHTPYLHLFIENRDRPDETLFKELRKKFDDNRMTYSVPKRISIYPKFPRNYKGEIDTKALCQFL